MAVVNSIVSLTARSALAVDEFTAALLGRFAAISRTNDSLIRGAWTEADLRQLVESEIAPFRDQHDNINLNGLDVQIDGQIAVALALVFHGLATNAAKYGALSNTSGCLDVNWQVSLDTKRQLEVTWKESGGPAVAVPTCRGLVANSSLAVFMPVAARSIRPIRPTGSGAASFFRLPEIPPSRTIQRSCSG